MDTDDQNTSKSDETEVKQMLLPTKENNKSEHHNSGHRVGIFKETEGKAE